MDCRHPIHNKCFKEYIKTNFVCPTCHKSLSKVDWKYLEEEIESVPLPGEFANAKVLVLCNDCNAKSTVKFHFFGNKCAECGTFNTTILEKIGFPLPGGNDE
eukprot:TRINITY_DN1467_c0_g1_i2.p1 TRINITY_DN1467_c0_g1~~TRINITY_DN1467_c0_g1_i2.p1  ORF type:complete len:102 (+),score=9.66 TRINITY_DN1467_c0_g1_i2:262-567(+)